jgi:hypothetical protein
MAIFATGKVGVRSAGVKSVRNSEVAIVLMCRRWQLLMPLRIEVDLEVHKMRWVPMSRDDTSAARTLYK